MDVLYGSERVAVHARAQRQHAVVTHAEHHQAIPPGAARGSRIVVHIRETAPVGFYAGPGLMSGRVVIPIHDPRGRLVAYAGRARSMGRHPSTSLRRGSGDPCCCSTCIALPHWTRKPWLWWKDTSIA
ncbi:MAG: hypothetical protein IT158_31560 [Bryobacterales bacterium]|nr:hypothetical protein [Bryobacterales bacterium]